MYIPRNLACYMYICPLTYSQILPLHDYCFLNRFWWVKIRALAQVGDYEELEKFSKQKKSPIGYEVKCFWLSLYTILKSCIPMTKLYSLLPEFALNMGIVGKHLNILQDAHQSPNSNYTWKLSKLWLPAFKVLLMLLYLDLSMNVTRIDTGSYSWYSTSIKPKPDRVGTVVQKDIVATSTLLSLLSLYTFLYFHSYSSPVKIGWGA